MNALPHALRWTALALLLIGGAAQAQVYKCRGADGKLAYTEQPCPPGAAAQPVANGQQKADGSVLLKGDLPPPARHSANECAGLRSAWQARVDERNRLMREDNLTHRNGTAGPAAADGQRQQLARDIEGLQRTAERGGCRITGDAPPAAASAATSASAAADTQTPQCRRYQDAIDREYEQIVRWNEALRQRDPRMTQSGGARLAASDAAHEAASRDTIERMTRQGAADGCKGVGATPAQLAAEKASKG